MVARLLLWQEVLFFTHSLIPSSVQSQGLMHHGHNPDTSWEPSLGTITSSLRLLTHHFFPNSSNLPLASSKALLHAFHWARKGKIMPIASETPMPRHSTYSSASFSLLFVRLFPLTLRGQQHIKQFSQAQRGEPMSPFGVLVGALIFVSLQEDRYQHP